MLGPPPGPAWPRPTWIAQGAVVTGRVAPEPGSAARHSHTGWPRLGGGHTNTSTTQDSVLPLRFRSKMLIMVRFEELQDRLGPALEANRPGSGIEHVLVALPSYSVGESLLSHYANRIPAMEHRYLLGSLILNRVEACSYVFVTCQAPSAEVLAYYSSLLSSSVQDVHQARFRVLVVPDLSARPVASKLLDRPDLLDELRGFIGGRPALIEPWNVTDAEVEVACRLGVPINGTSPTLRHLGYKSAGRRLFATAGVPTPAGIEDVRTIDEALAAIATLRSVRPGIRAVVIKHDDSGAGDGNVVIDLITPSQDAEGLRERLGALPEWYLADLASKGGVVEELIAGEWIASPSAQIDIDPSGEVRVLATHEQVLGGDNGQVYMGCRFPANDAYGPEIAEHALAAGRELARAGALGRVAVDFVTARDANGRWSVSALELNLRKGGTTHPYAALRNLVPGSYDVDSARWVTSDGTIRAYFSTDNVIDAKWQNRSPSSVIAAVANAGLGFDPGRGTGIVLHMLSCLAIDGRFGLTAIGRSPGHAQELYQHALQSVAASCS